MIYEKFKEGVARVWAEDASSQEHYLSIIAEDTRSLPLEVFKKFGAFFVPNDGYLIKYFEPDCAGYQYELYGTDGVCNLRNCVVFPCYTLSGRIIAWVAYNPFTRLKNMESGDYSQNYYSYPSKLVFNKKFYIFTLPEVYKKALKDGYLILTDGVYDTISFVHYGLNAASLLGSYLNPNTAFYLRFISKIYVSVDNDEAGLKMLSNVRRLIPHAKAIKQGATKDSDEILKSHERDTYLAEINRGIMQYTDVVLRSKISS